MDDHHMNFQQWTVKRKELKSGLGDSLKITAYFIPTDSRYLIATVNGKNYGAYSNAKLMAAAPQLLNAANDALAVLLSLQAENPGRNADVDATIRLLIAAIAKAKDSEK